jgi:hypothetical protein
VYAYDAARSDGILVIHDLLATHGVAPDDLTFSSGKAMKFTWNGLTFVDICSSLSAPSPRRATLSMSIPS